MSGASEAKSAGEVILDAAAIERAIQTLAHEVAERVERPALVGIRRGGVGLSHRLSALLGGAPIGTVDISLYRDDAATALPDPKIGPSKIPFEVAGRDVILIDDVLQTGRTIRAAIDCLLDYGRPRRVWLLTLFDRGGRELPIGADFVGHTLALEAGQRLDVTIGSEASDEDRAEKR